MTVILSADATNIPMRKMSPLLEVLIAIAGTDEYVPKSPYMDMLRGDRNKWADALGLAIDKGYLCEADTSACWTLSYRGRKYLLARLRGSR
jgi:hypothetical protein